MERTRPERPASATGAKGRGNVHDDDREGDPGKRPPEPDDEDEREGNGDTDRRDPPDSEEEHESPELVSDTGAVGRAEHGIGEATAGDPEDPCDGAEDDKGKP